MQVSDVVNVGLLAHPYNWVVVILILLGASLALCLLQAPLGQIGGLTQVV
jgi:hypothetical protein